MRLSSRAICMGLPGNRRRERLGSERSVVAGDVVEALADAFRLLG